MPAKGAPKWFPYLATLFLFVAVNNLISFIPFPTSHESGHLPGSACRTSACTPPRPTST